MGKQLSRSRAAHAFLLNLIIDFSSTLYSFHFALENCGRFMNDFGLEGALGRFAVIKMQLISNVKIEIAVATQLWRMETNSMNWLTWINRSIVLSSNEHWRFRFGSNPCYFWCRIFLGNFFSFFSVSNIISFLSKWNESGKHFYILFYYEKKGFGRHALHKSV